MEPKISISYSQESYLQNHNTHQQHCQLNTYPVLVPRTETVLCSFSDVFDISHALVYIDVAAMELCF